MKNIIMGIIVFAIIYLSYLFVIILNKKRLNKYITASRETNLVKNKYNLDYGKLSHKMVANTFAISNALIISITYIVLILMNKMIIGIFVSLLLMIVLLVISYQIIGYLLKKKEVK